MAPRATLPEAPGLTLIPGVEWTHYQGHANFLGVDTPYDEPFAANTPDEIQSRFASARRRGALIMINHPFEAGATITATRPSSSWAGQPSAYTHYPLAQATCSRG